MKILILSFSAILILGCKQANSGENSKPSSNEFNNYWYSGKAELTSYELEQARYGEIHKGEAVLIFVTEDFWKDKQVKYEFGEKTDKVTPILKLNFERKFNTGIYPYSMMTSIFTPTSGEKTLKITSTSQEWCGHTFLQLNLRSESYESQLFSYFQGEGDKKSKIKTKMLEDEIWTKIRLNPETLPIGEIELIPSTTYSRLKHQQLKSEKAVAKITVNGTTKTYELSYKDFQRKLKINFNSKFPFEIQSWEETHLSGFGNPKLLTTKGTKKKSIKLDYWSKNSVADSTYRKSLGLNP
ncbi:MAG: septum formation inhibitor Maf [Calditrichaeota bacterium]|nr:MAG: septum formation inhibitor Maf [Calditrichota bacterium]